MKREYLIILSHQKPFQHTFKVPYHSAFSKIEKPQNIQIRWSKKVKRGYQARTLRALGLLLADGTPYSGRGEDFLTGQPNFFTETAVTPERKVEKWFPKWEINRHAEG